MQELNGCLPSPCTIKFSAFLLVLGLNVFVPLAIFITQPFEFLAPGFLVVEVTLNFLIVTMGDIELLSENFALFLGSN